MSVAASDPPAEELDQQELIAFLEAIETEEQTGDGEAEGAPAKKKQRKEGKKKSSKKPKKLTKAEAGFYEAQRGREESDEAKQIFTSLRSVVGTGNSLKDALSRSLTTMMAENHIRSQESSQQYGMNNSFFGGMERTNSGISSPMMANGPTMETTQGMSRTFSQSSVTFGGVTQVGSSTQIPLGDAHSAHSQSIADITNRMLSSVQQRKHSRVEAVMIRHNSDRILALQDAAKARGKGPTNPKEVESDPFGVELHIESDDAVVIEQPTANAKEDKAQRKRRRGEDFEDDLLLGEAAVDINAEGAADEDSTEVSDDGDDDESEDDDDNDKAGRDDGNFSSEEDEETLKHTEKLQRKHEMERLRKSIQVNQPKSAGCSPTSTPSSYPSPLFPAATAAQQRTAPKPPVPVTGFQDAAAKRKALLTARTGSVFAGVSADHAQLVQRTASYESSSLGPVVFEAKKQPNGDSNGKPNDSGKSEAKKKGRTLSLVTKV